MPRLLAYGAVTLVLVAAGVLVRAQLDLTTFVPGTPILAGEVNANFDAVAGALGDLQALPSVRTLNALVGDVNLVAGDGVVLGVDAAAGEITIASTALGTAGGDVTAVTAGVGLAGGGAAGDLSLRIANSYRLPQACADGSVPEWNGAAWVCGAGAGDITAVTAGSGLTGGGDAGAVALAVDFAGAGSADSAARSDHHHLGQTWQGSGPTPLVLEAPAEFSTTTGGVLVLRNTGSDGAGLLVSESGHYGIWVRTPQDTGLVIDGAGDNAIYTTADGYGAELHGAEGGLLVGGTTALASTDAVPDIVLSGNSCAPCGAEDDDGRIHSDPDRASSDIFLVSNDAVIVQLDADDDEAGHFQVQDHAGAAVFQVAEDGEVRVNGVVVHSSDRALKKVLERVDGRSILERLAILPIHRWTFRHDGAAAPHLGPTAQDFHAAFGLGSDERYIGTVDADGVALAAIQGLHQLLLAQEEVIAEQQARLAEQEARLATLEARLGALEAAAAPGER